MSGSPSALKSISIFPVRFLEKFTPMPPPMLAWPMLKLPPKFSPVLSLLPLRTYKPEYVSLSKKPYPLFKYTSRVSFLQTTLSGRPSAFMSIHVIAVSSLPPPWDAPALPAPSKLILEFFGLLDAPLEGISKLPPKFMPPDLVLDFVMPFSKIPMVVTSPIPPQGCVYCT